MANLVTSNPYPPLQHLTHEVDFSYHYALELVERGFSILPCRGKRPIVDNWKEYQTRLPNQEELKAWFGPDATHRHNIAIVCGKLSGIVVADTDNPEATTWWRNQKEIAETPLAVRTGRGGMHFYYKRPPTIPEIRNRIRIEDMALDLRSDNGLAVAPPSVHPETNRAYEWVTPISEISLDDIPEFSPEWLPKKRIVDLRPGTAFDMREADRNLRRLRAYIRKIESIEGHGGSNGCWRAANYLVEAGLSRELCLQELLAWNEESHLVQPKWSESELQHKLDDAIRKHKST